jgi:hypothetical protein
MKKHNKLKLAVVVSIISIIITILSLTFSVYVGLKDVEYKDYLKNIQGNSQELQKGNILFQESYSKINLVEKTLSDTINNCKVVNKDELNKNLGLLTDARTALINDDYPTVSINLNKIDQRNICSITEHNPDSIYLEIGTLAFIWLLLVITLIKVTRK